LAKPKTACFSGGGGFGPAADPGRSLGVEQEVRCAGIIELRWPWVPMTAAAGGTLPGP
jgi:hypothetical protein